MAELKFDSGVKEYTVNGKSVVSFNPTDVHFARKVFHVFEQMDAKQGEYEGAAKNTDNVGAFFAVYERIDTEIRAMIDETLGEGVSAAVFGTTSVMALSGGLPLWANLLLAIMDEMDESVSREIKLSDERLAKYTKKYQK